MISIYRSKYEYIKNFQLYGERHSGTNFLENSLRNIFNLEQTSFFGGKHFFGFSKPETITYERHTLFVGIVRDPYDWILAMYSLPHHVSKVNKKSFLDFITNAHTKFANIKFKQQFKTINYYSITDSTLITVRRRFLHIFGFIFLCTIFVLTIL